VSAGDAVDSRGVPSAQLLRGDALRSSESWPGCAVAEPGCQKIRLARLLASSGSTGSAACEYDRAITQAYERLTEREDDHQHELAAIERKLAETQTAMDRYFRAFETGSMPEDTCAPRIAVLGEEAKALQARASELGTQNDEQPERTTPAKLETLRSTLRAALKDTTPTRAKTVL
jgi:hypothetical protein